LTHDRRYFILLHQQKKQNCPLWRSIEKNLEPDRDFIPAASVPPQEITPEKEFSTIT
jgi:hypothetical protein